MTHDGPTGRRARRALLALAGLLLPVALAGQAPDPSSGRPLRASPSLPSEHWAVRAAERAEELGLAPGFFPAQRAAPAATVAAALDEAARRAEGTPLAVVAAGWRERFLEAFPEHATGVSPSEATRLGARAGVGLREREGGLSPAIGFFGTRLDPSPVAERSGAFARGAGGVALGPRASAYVALAADGGGIEAEGWELSVAALGMVLAGGLGEARYGPGSGGGIVFSVPRPLPRVELRSEEALRLPGFLGRAGPIMGHSFLTRLDDGRHVQRPWLWGARVAFRPHDRFTVGINRGAIFGGDSTTNSLRNFGGMVLGVLSDDYENQIVSMDGRWRLPTDAILPATVYLEWGAEDGAGAWHRLPARLAGVRFPAIPGAPGASAGFEGVRFAACCRHGVWYMHSTFRGNWARGTTQLGHPLGGEGHELAAFLSADLRESAIRLDGRLALRNRSDETLRQTGGGNLFTPQRSGRSVALRGRGEFLLSREVELRADLFHERGDGWRERRLETELRWLLP